MDLLHMFPGTGSAGPSFRMTIARFSVDLATLFKNGHIFSSMAVIGRDKTNAAMEMLIVVPVNKIIHPCTCLFNRGKGTTRVCWPILQSAK